MTDSAPGWLPDPSGKHDHRYWDGTGWTENIADAGVAGIDPYDPSAPVADATEVDTPAASDAPTVEQPAATDPTAAWPTTPGAPAPPPPYVASTPVAAGGGGSKKGLLIGGGILAAVAVAVAAFLALGGDDKGSDGDLRAQLASKFREESDSPVSKSEAECLADYYVDELGADAFKGIDLDDPDSEPPPELEDEFTEVGLKAAEECVIDFGADESTTTSESPDDGGSGDAEEGTYGSDPELDALWDDCEAGDFQACDDLYIISSAGSEYEDFGYTCGDRNEPQGYCVDVYEDGGGTTDTTDGSPDTTDASDLPPNFEELLADTYESTFNLSREKAECLAGALATAIEDGSIGEEEVMSDFMNYLTDCDITLDEISGG